jgi:hypothetical protein
MQVHTYAIDKEGKKIYYLSFLSPEEIQEPGLTARNVIGTLKTMTEKPTEEDVKINPAFLKLFHQTIAEYCPGEDQFIKEAEKMGSGALLVFDQRSNKSNRLEEDIIGAFEVKEGKLFSDTYRLNANYKIIGIKGMFSLPLSFFMELKKAMMEKETI